MQLFNISTIFKPERGTKDTMNLAMLMNGCSKILPIWTSHDTPDFQNG